MTTAWGARDPTREGSQFSTDAAADVAVWSFGQQAPRAVRPRDIEDAVDDLAHRPLARSACRANLHNVTLPLLLPGITLNTSPTDYQPIKQLQQIRFTGKTWELFDE